jgi:hypothetical protein
MPDFPSQISRIQQQLKRKTVIFETGGKPPTKEILESWIGRIGFCQEVLVDASACLAEQEVRVASQTSADG